MELPLVVDQRGYLLLDVKKVRCQNRWYCPQPGGLLVPHPKHASRVHQLCLQRSVPHRQPLIHDQCLPP
eukprot:CAMPEP_0113715904 /NCGR_PEP_ID=MMETSP0038_2-20120614/33555_1 /TAXON_ID=2898 /ORGANISM="Cryptomonas paramecium" /LENGTH=68 /DNA_ID=CAMNT_0000643291 /DNA_START=253 /DNA_END=455 /DNA_ORIENTATION=+ /assembly_acc=CAM_ASM_000170